MFFDLFGALFSLISTYYFIRVDSKAWSIGVLATCLNTWLYWQSGIYADMCLESFYFLSTAYGWYNWTHTPRQSNEHQINSLTIWQWWYLAGLGSLIYIVVYTVLIFYAHSTVAKLDALTTTLSLIAQLLMCHKIISTWVFWFITDALFAIMYYQKHLPFHTALMFLYTGMAVIGYLSWWQKSRLAPASLTV